MWQVEWLVPAGGAIGDPPDVRDTKADAADVYTQPGTDAAIATSASRTTTARAAVDVPRCGRAVESIADQSTSGASAARPSRDSVITRVCGQVEWFVPAGANAPGDPLHAGIVTA